MDGQAESFFAYGFEQVAVQRYQDAQGSLLNVEIWQLATPADAYGLFSTARAGSPAAIGNEADSDPGRRLAFWQERCFVSLNALQPVPDETLQAFAQAISSKLPPGGERPAIVDRLPPSGLVERSAIFFHEEIFHPDGSVAGRRRTFWGSVRPPMAWWAVTSWAMGLSV